MPPVVTVLQCRDASASLQIICQTDEQYTITICGLHNIWSTETQIDQTGKLLIIFDVAPAKSEIANKNPVCQFWEIYNTHSVLADTSVLSNAVMSFICI